MKYSLFSILLFQLQIQDVFGSCGVNSCPDGYPAKCNSTCGCPPYAVGRKELDKKDDSIKGDYKKPTLIWSNCTTIENITCTTGKAVVIPFIIEDEVWDDPIDQWKTYTDAGKYACTDLKWTMTGDQNNEKEYYYSCKQ